jgi:hypothetical protein
MIETKIIRPFFAVVLVFSFTGNLALADAGIDQALQSLQGSWQRFAKTQDGQRVTVRKVVSGNSETVTYSDVQTRRHSPMMRRTANQTARLTSRGGIC